MNTKGNLATKATIAYFTVSTSLVFFTDRLLRSFGSASDEFSILDTLEGVLFVAATSIFLYLLISALSRKQCNRCHSILQTVNDAVLIYNSATGEILDVNRQACEMFGLDRCDYLNTSRKEGSASAKNNILVTAREWFDRFTTDTPARFEWKTVRSNGITLWVEITLQKVVIKGIERKIAVARDITAYKDAESSLNEINRTLRMLLKCNEVLIRATLETELLRDICKIFVEDGGYMCAWVGLNDNDSIDKIRPAAQAGFLSEGTAMADFPKYDSERGQEAVRKAVRTGTPCIVRDVRKDSPHVPCHDVASATGYLSSLSVPLVSSGKVLGALTVCATELDAFDGEEVKLMCQLAGDLAYGIMSLRTVDEQKRIEKELVASERNLAEAQSIAMMGSWEYDMEKDQEHRSDEFFRILGVPPAKGGRAEDSLFDYIHPDDRDFVMERIVETMEKGKPYDVEYRIIRPDGAERVIHARGKTLENTAGKYTRFLGTALDITERKLIESALRDSELRFRSLVEATTDWIWEIDSNSRYVYSSPKGRDLLGLESREIIGKTLFDLLRQGEANSQDKNLVEIVTARNPFFGFEMEAWKDGTVVIIETSGVPILGKNGAFCGYRGISRDITERKKLERKYMQAQKMEVVGRLAGGIAHDFNNILTAILGFEHLLRERLRDERSLHFAKQISLLAEKASYLTHDLLAFSRKQPMNPKLIDLNDNIRKLGKLLERLIGEDVELRLTLQEGELPILAVSGHMEQVFMNLATNARDAMPNGGMLTIKTENTVIDSNFIRMSGYGTPGRYALVSVSDTGSGMDEETRQQIFEPFFTTKEVGKGTGLGLSTAYGIVRQHSGFISVYSEPGEGSTFRIYLPILAEDVAKEQEREEMVLPPPGRETVLLVEDEPGVSEMTSALLEKHGYHVHTASDGDEALELYVANEEEIDLLILDVIMPKKNGKEIYDIIRKNREDIKTIFISGYTADIVEQKGIPKNCHLVPKPYSPYSFLWKVRNVLDGLGC